MAVYTTNLTIYTGTNFDQVFVLANDVDDSAFNLTGYTGISKIKRRPGSLTATSFTTSFTDVTAGKVKISLSSEQTSALSPGRYYYDILLSMGGENTKVIEGDVIIKKSITRY
jgi:hypothetical protein|tara:strand:+ start:471 stop:809 length:339 start_codon:yes stop_codon:yes gene_type:complete